MKEEKDKEEISSKEKKGNKSGNRHPHNLNRLLLGFVVVVDLIAPLKAGERKQSFSIRHLRFGFLSSKNLITFIWITLKEYYFISRQWLQRR